MSAFKTGTIAAALVAAFSLPALAQEASCVPNAAFATLVEQQGWTLLDAIAEPRGTAIAVYCDGDASVLVHLWPEDGLSCQIATDRAGCRAPEQPGTES